MKTKALLMCERVRALLVRSGHNPDMTMFNVVFVLNPPALEHQLRVKDMYDNVTKKYAKALKYEEARFHYVWKESKRIIDIKQRAKENRDSRTATWRNIVCWNV